MWARKLYFSTDAQRLCKLGSHSVFTSEGGAAQSGNYDSGIQSYKTVLLMRFIRRL